MCGLCDSYADPEGEFERACDDRDRYRIELGKFQPIAWETDQGLVVRTDYREKIQDWRGFVDFNRAIPCAWTPVLFVRG